MAGRFGRGIAGAGLAVVGAGGLVLAYNPDVFSERNTTALEAAPTTMIPGSEPAAETTPPLPTAAPTAAKEQFDYNEVFVGSDGYAWPIGRPHRSLYYAGVEYTLPCEMPKCHHDHTAAVDVAYADAGSHNPMRPENAGVTGEDDIVGEPVRAIMGGTIEVESFQDIPGCQRIQLHADNGYYFWYGHLENAIVGNGQTAEVETGQQIATVGRWDCVGSSQAAKSYAHGHIDMGCTTDEGPQRGGNDSCRDPQFAVIMNRLFAEIPE